MSENTEEDTKPKNQALSEDRTDLAEDRTDLAEDRTLLANERTYAGWCRTAFASIALGLGFHALFGKVEAVWVVKAIATLFILLGIYIIHKAYLRAREVVSNNTQHEVNVAKPDNFRILAWCVKIGAAILVVAIWWLT